MGITARAGGGVGWASAPFTVLGEQGPRGSHRVLASRGSEEQMPGGKKEHGGIVKSPCRLSGVEDSQED